MAQCEGTTKAGARCKRVAMEGSRFCSLHVPEEAQGDEPAADPRRAQTQDEDWASILLAAAAVGGMLFVLSLWRKWLPKSW